MSIDDPDRSKTEAELALIEFNSPGRFTIANPSAILAEPAQQDQASFSLGLTAKLQSFGSANEAHRHLMALIGQARRSLRLYSPDFEPWLYNHSSVRQACTRFLLDNPRNRLRALLGDSSRAVKQGHQLLSLSRRLSSNMHIRKVHHDYPAQTDAFLVVDDCGVLIRPKPDEFKGYVLYNDPGRARQLQRQFDMAWEHSLSDPDLRSFLL